jgi:uncharacterized protein YbjT (DUF2867 family)
MKLTVFAATGGIGRQLLDQALAAGHDVTAVVRNPATLPAEVRAAGVASHGTLAIVEAMRATGVRRVVVVSAAPVATVASPGRPDPPRHDPGDGLVTRRVLMPLLLATLREVYRDLALMEDALRDSTLDWTVVRPPRLTDGPLTGTYRTALGRNLRGGLLVSRADVAHLMLATLDRPETIGQTIGIANGRRHRSTR